MCLEAPERTFTASLEAMFVWRSFADEKLAVASEAILLSNKVSE